MVTKLGNHRKRKYQMTKEGKSFLKKQCSYRVIVFVKNLLIRRNFRREAVYSTLPHIIALISYCREKF